MNFLNFYAVKFFLVAQVAEFWATKSKKGREKLKFKTLLSNIYTAYYWEHCFQYQYQDV